MPTTQPDSNDMGIGEIGRILVGVRDEQRAFRSEVNDKFGALDGTYVRADVFLLKTQAQADRIGKLENTLQWVTRTVAGGAIVAVVSGVVGAVRIASGS